MDKGLEQTFLQRRYIDGQRAYEKMLNITTIREMQIKTQRNIISDPLGWSLSKNKQKITSADKDVEKLELLVECKMIQLLWKIV